MKKEAEGKIPAEKICEILKTQEMAPLENFDDLLRMIELGKVNKNNLNQAMNLTENGLSLKFLYANSLDELTKDELKELTEIVASKASNRGKTKLAREQGWRDYICEVDAPLLPKDLSARSRLTAEISKKLTALTKVNKVANSVSSKFINEFDDIANAFAKAKYSIEDLSKAGGVQLSYTRDALKDNISKLMKDLPLEEQQKIYEKFGLNKVSNMVINGLPVHLDAKGLSPIESQINDEIGKFLFKNKIVLPKGFEEYQKPLEEICETFPEFMYTIGSRQHGTHNKKLSEHILMAFEENMKNPLYSTLNSSDRKVLGISTILHDINKTELTVDPNHPLISSQTANAIVQRMQDLTVAEKNRIINFIENHHWLMSVAQGPIYKQDIVNDLAFKFRSGNDFAMAKIFAESDLKAVNRDFFSMYGRKINSPMTEAIEKEIVNIQSKGRMIFTADVTADYAKKCGAKAVELGSGAEKTTNLVVSAKALGLDSQNVLYHAPGADDAFLLALSGMGYGNGGVLSTTLGRNNHSATFQRRGEFFIFRRPDMNRISGTFKKNANLGTNKGYNLEKELLLRDISFSKNVKEKYLAQTNLELSDVAYAKIFREVPTMENISQISTNKKVQEILGGEKNAKIFENIIKDTNEMYVATSKNAPSGEFNFSEIVASDLQVGAIGTNRLPEEISYADRKLCQDNNWAIVTFD